MHILLIYLITCTMWSVCYSFLGGDQSCKVHIDNHQAELKQLIGKQEQFNLNNWSHTATLIVLALLGVLLFIVICVIRTKYWRAMKSIHNHTAQNNQQKQIPVNDKPYLIHNRGRNNIAFIQEEQQEA